MGTPEEKKRSREAAAVAIGATTAEVDEEPLLLLAASAEAAARPARGSRPVSREAALDDETCERVITTISPGLRIHPRISVESLREAVAQTRATGFAMSQGKVVAESFGLGAIVPDSHAAPALAVSIAAHVSVVSDANIARWKRIIKEEIHAAAAAGIKS